MGKTSSGTETFLECVLLYRSCKQKESLMYFSVHKLSKAPAQGSAGKPNLSSPATFIEAPWVLSRKQKKGETYAHAELETGGNAQQSIKCIKVDLLISFSC